jgi:Family of unknown function (DUF5677)
VHGAQRLWDVAEAVGRRLRDTYLEVPATFKERLLIDTTMISFRQIIVQARCIPVLVSEVGPSEAAYTNLRTMYEHYMDLRYLLQGNPQEQQRKALRIHLYARWDVIRHLPTIGGAESLRDELAEWLQVDNELTTIVQGEWQKQRPPNHWSGTSRTATIRAVNPDPKGNLNDYKFLSWMAHPFTAHVITSVKASPVYTEVADVFEPQSTARILCRKATRVLLRSWGILNEQEWYKNRRAGPPGRGK